MSRKLPNGWVETTLGELVSPSRSRALPSDTPDLPYVGMEHIEPQTMMLLGHGNAHDTRSSSVRFNKGDVLYGKLRPYLNKVWIAEFSGLCSAEFLVFPSTKGLNSHFLAYRLNASDFVQFANNQVSGERPRVGFEKLARFSVLLPPSEEQNRIVNKLNALLERVADGENTARRAIDRIQNYRVSVLQAAVTGELTRNWREKHPVKEEAAALLKRLLVERRTRWENTELSRLRGVGKTPKNDKWKERYRKPAEPDVAGLRALPPTWVWASWNQVSDWVTYGFTRPMPHVSKGIPIITARHLKDGRIDFRSTHKTTRRAFNELSPKDIPQVGDILLTKDGTIGRAAVVDDDREFCINQSVAALWLRSTQLEREYLLHVIASPETQSRITARARGVAIKHLSVSDFAKMALPLPPMPEQEAIAREVTRKLSASDQLSATLHTQIERATQIRHSLFQRAFTGNLVPQAEQDVSAAALLNDIRSAQRLKTNIQRVPHMSTAKPRPVETLEQLEEVIRDLGKSATPERVLLTAGMDSDVESFFDLLRAGRDNGTLIVPVGEGSVIRLSKHAN